MSGTYRIDGELFLTNPLQKQWTRKQIGKFGNGEPVFSSYWSVSLTFPIMDFGSGSAGNYLMQHWLDDELHSAVLPHPQSGYLTVFSGVAIDDVSLNIMSFDNDGWVDSGRVTLSHLSLNQSWSVEGQGSWWFEPPLSNVDIGISGSGSYSP